MCAVVNVGKKYTSITYAGTRSPLYAPNVPHLRSGIYRARAPESQLERPGASVRADGNIKTVNTQNLEAKDGVPEARHTALHEHARQACMDCESLEATCVCAVGW